MTMPLPIRQLYADVPNDSDEARIRFLVESQRLWMQTLKKTRAEAGVLLLEVARRIMIEDDNDAS